jgi:hypothetical protein
MPAALALALALAEPDPGRVDPDRPTISNTTVTVPRGAVQLEAGVDAQVFGRADLDDFRVAAPLVIRIGLHDRAELRLFDADPARWLIGQVAARQQSDASIGAKIKLVARGPSSLALQPHLTLLPPRGPASFWAPLPGLTLLYTLDPGSWDLTLNAGAELTPSSDTWRCCEVSNLLAAAVTRDLADDRVRLWGEVYARLELPRIELGELAGNAGVIVLLHRRLALDLGLLVGRARGALVVAALAGLSVRLGPRRAHASARASTLSAHQ